MNRVIWVFLACIILLSVVIGLKTKSSYVNTDTGISRNQYSAFPSYPFVIEDYILDEFDLADFIAKVTFTGERSDAYRSLKSIVLVNEVYLGDSEMEGENIAIYELNYFDSRFKRYINYTHCGLMQEGNSYYVFLAEKNYLDAYQKTLDYYEYYPYPWEVSVFPTTNTKREPIDPTRELIYSDIAEYEFLFFDDEEYERVLEIQQMLIDKYCN